MPILRIEENLPIQIDGLARQKPLWELSEKRITTVARQVLRKRYGARAVRVACEVTWCAPAWNGSCEIHGTRRDYAISIA